MTETVTRLANGLTVVTHTMPHLETTSLGLWVRVGARHEEERENGISHFLEHMSFKGTATRSAQAIAEEIEAVGGDLNAATGLETTAYYARVLKGDEGVALTLLADILLNSKFSADELDREREVILQEIAGTRDSPEDMVFELLNETAYPGQAIGRTILGTAARVRAFTAADLKSFLAKHYRPENMVLAAAGAVRHGPFLRHAEALFGGLTQGDSVASSAPNIRAARVRTPSGSSKATLCSRSRGRLIAIISISRLRFFPVFSVGACRPDCSRRRGRSVGFAIRSIRRPSGSATPDCSRFTPRRGRK